MIDIKAAKELKHSITTGFDSGGMRAAEALIASIEEEYGSLDAAPPTPFLNWMNQVVAIADKMAEEPATEGVTPWACDVCGAPGQKMVGPEGYCKQHWPSQAHQEVPTTTQGITDAQLEKVILEVLAAEDYDIYKSFLPACSEEPEEIPRRMAALVQVARRVLTEQHDPSPQTIRLHQRPQETT